MTQSPAGWHLQPDGRQRFWDGEQWTEHYAPGPQQFAPPNPLMPGVYPHPSGYQVAAKSPAVSLLASFFLPGLGSMINGDVGKGVGILIGYFVALVLSIVLIGIPFAIGLWIWAMVDGYQGAVTWNSRHGIIS